jgi:hypothetical protein
MREASQHVSIRLQTAPRQFHRAVVGASRRGVADTRDQGGVVRPSQELIASRTPHKLECPAGEEDVYETQARNRHSLRRTRRTSGG